MAVNAFRQKKAAASCPINPGMREGDDDEDNITVSQLESTITEERSPIRRRPAEVRRRKKNKKQFRQLVATLPSPGPEVEVENLCIQVVESQVDENLNSQIFEVSTQQQPSTSRSGLPEEALEIESAGASSGWTHHDGAIQSGESATSGEVGRSQEGKSLLESFKAMKTKHDSKVRLFGHDLRNGKYQEVVSLSLVIRQVVERQDKVVKTIAYDIADDKYKWIIFKSSDPFEIVDGVCVKLFMPWQEIYIEGSAEPVIVGADFYKIFRCSNFNLTKQNISEILNLALPTPSEIRVLEPLFMDLVPYHIKNSRTVEKQVSRSRSYIDIGIVVLNVWGYSYSTTSPVLCLIKDSDDFVTFLEIPKVFEDLISELSSGKYLKMTSVAVHKKIRISEQLAPFSVIRLFGGKQSYFFSLKWENVSTWEHVTCLDIAMNFPRSNFLSMDEIDTASRFLDLRVSLKCKLTEKERRHLLVRDLDSDSSLMIDVVLGSDFCIGDVPVSINDRIILKFIRLINGKAIWDHFTACEDLSEEDWISSTS